MFKLKYSKFDHPMTNPNARNSASIPNALITILQRVPDIGNSMRVIPEVRHPFQTSTLLCLTLVGSF